MFGLSKKKETVTITQSYSHDVHPKYLGTVAHRGYIYAFIEKDGTHKNDVLIVSSDARSTDKLVSIIMIGDNPEGDDVIKIRYNGRTRYIHRELVTFCKRTRLGDMIAPVSADIMARVDEGLARGLGLI